MAIVKMTKGEEALYKAKESGKKVVEGGKEFGTGLVQVVGGTMGTIGYALTSGYEKGASITSEIRENEEGISENEKEKRRNNADKYNEKSKEHIVKAGEFGKTAVKGAGKVVKGGAKVIGHTVKGGYHLIDAGDKAIGEQIEKKQMEKGKKTGRIGTFFRDNILKLLIVLSATGYGGYKASQLLTDKQKNKTEIVEGLTENQQFVKDFFASPDVIRDLKSSGEEYQKKWEDRYLGEDDAWNNMRNGFGFAERKKVIEGMCRMIESGHLEMVLKKADEAGVPIQCVFLALAESGWQAGANSGVAGGYWQFTIDTAKRYGLIDAQGNDYRSDPEKSTDAAMRHLKDNYNTVCRFAKDLGYNLSESNKWILAFYMFNGSQGLVQAGMTACKGNANEYSNKLEELARENGGYIKIRGKLKKVDAPQNANYVPRILGIQDALEKTFRENGYNTQKIRAVCLNQKQVEKTEADLMYEEFLKESESLNQEERLQRLDEVKTKYEKEYKEGLISKNYYKGAMRVIGDAIIYEKEEDDEE